MSLDPQVQALVERLAAEQQRLGASDLATLRAGYAPTATQLGGPPAPVAEVLDLDAGGVPARGYVPDEAADGAPGLIVWAHGGGWLFGDLDGFDRVCRALCVAAGHRVLSVDYRLAPEHPFPAAWQDVCAAVRWAASEAGAGALGHDPERVLVGGDSAGGNLAAVAARRERHAVRAQILVYPALDAAMSGDSYAQFAEDPMLGGEAMAQAWAAYLGEADRGLPDASPLAAQDMAPLPPARIAVASHDVLRDDGLRYAQRLRDAGVAVHSEVCAGTVHGFLRWGGVVARANELIADMGAYARAALAA